jgi:hypothetical protein
MANLPTPGGSGGTWGTELNAYLNEQFTAINTKLDTIMGNQPQLPTTTLSVNATGNTITVSWAGVTGATGYIVGRNGVDQYGTPGTAAQVGPAVLSQVFPNLTYGTEYTFSVQPLPSGRVSVIKATTSAPPAGNTSTTVSVVNGDGQATLNWTAVTGATGYLVGRDGTDSGGFGAYSTTDPASATSRTFLSLVNGTTYTLFCEPQGTAAPAYPTTGHGRKTITVTPAATAPPTGTTVVTMSGVTSTQATLNWTAVSGSTGYLIGRDGSDSDGSGAFQTAVGSGVTSQTFLKLIPGATYTFFVQPSPSGIRTNKVLTVPVTGTTPGTPPTGSGTAWLSGSCGTEWTQQAGFDTWRGEPQTYIRFWTDNSLDNMNLMGWYVGQRYANWTGGTLDIGCGGPGHPGGATWATAATGAMDALWRKQCQDLHANWGTLKCVHLSMAHEINGDWFPWSVNSGNVTYMKQAWVRWYGIVQQELKDKGRNVKVVLNYAAGRNMVDAIWPGNAYVDIVGMDSYDMYMPTGTGNIRTDSEWNTWNNGTNALQGGDGSPWGFQSFATWAAGKGKPLTVPEWGISASSQYEYDNPFFIQKFYDWCKTVAPVDKDNPAPGKLAGEAYFNTWTQCQLWPTTNKPLSAAKYQSLKWGSTT